MTLKNTVLMCRECTIKQTIEQLLKHIYDNTEGFVFKKHLIIGRWNLDWYLVEIQRILIKL